jgi:hypothetical protein
MKVAHLEAALGLGDLVKRYPLGGARAHSASCQ